MYLCIVNRIKGQHEITTLTMSEQLHMERHSEFVSGFPHPSTLQQAHLKRLTSASVQEGGGVGGRGVSNYAASILDTTVIHRTCTSKGPLSDFAGHMNNSAYV